MINRNKRNGMKVFIPTNDSNEGLIKKGYTLKPLIIEAYMYHLYSFGEEKTQNLFNKKVNTGTVMTSKGKTRVL